MLSDSFKTLIDSALTEDLPTGDITTENLALSSRHGTAKLVAKSDLVLSGRAMFEQTVLRLEPQMEVTWLKTDGDHVLKGQAVCTLLGDLIQLLKAERTALNFIQHLSGIATITRTFVEQVRGTSAQIIDTRKTLPGYRVLEKRAVRDGGGGNHRMNLSESVMIKDNHIAVAGGITPAVTRIRQNHTGHICVEAASLDQVREAVQLSVERILLDNMAVEMLSAAVKLIPDAIEVEASGNMTLSRVREVAKTGVDFISVGALTHSAPAADLSLMFDWNTSTPEQSTP
jgi:nicotinate-nucleotide pyrophosphorylase (carboxylating)